jgi:hypothetical protein
LSSIARRSDAEIVAAVRQVESERLFQHVRALEGPRDPSSHSENLQAAANYILSSFRQTGLTAGVQEFSLAGGPGTFQNVEGALPGVDPELLVVAHYDTVADSPGADDNASAVAVMLEAARVLQKVGSFNLRFIGFTLEENDPFLEAKVHALAHSLGLMDLEHRYLRWHTHKLMKQLSSLAKARRLQTSDFGEALALAHQQLRPEMDESENRLAQEVALLYRGISSTSWPGILSAIGSARWLEQAIKGNRSIRGVICLDTVGYCSQQANSQHHPPGFDPSVFPHHGISDFTRGNFLAAAGDVQSAFLSEAFHQQSAQPAVDLPHISLQLPLTFSQFAATMPDLLRSDHAPFWRAGIPGLFLTDSAEFRYPYYHTPADTIDKLDFDFLTEVCQAVIATAIALA